MDILIPDIETELVIRIQYTIRSCAIDQGRSIGVGIDHTLQCCGGAGAAECAKRLGCRQLCEEGIVAQSIFEEILHFAGV